MLTICTGSTRRSAGILLFSGKRILLLKRSATSGNPNTWGLPGGRAETEETPYATALREAVEEMRRVPPHRVLGAVAVQRDWRRYEIIACRTARRVRDEWAPKLNHEHSKYRWVKLGWLEAKIEKLHPVLQAVVEDPRGRDWLRAAVERQVVTPGRLTGGRRASDGFSPAAVVA